MLFYKGKQVFVSGLQPLSDAALQEATLMKHADCKTKCHRAIASAWEVKSAEHRLNFVWIIHAEDTAATEESFTEVESNSSPSTVSSISDLQDMVVYTREANFEDVVLLEKAEMHLDQVESAVIIHCQQHEQGQAVVYDPTDLEDDIQVYDEFKGKCGALNGKIFSKMI
ncbi:hypothetical protein JVU11DRAFT_1232 [Chiua virens]|nr:hypothetical protein JVU11DRAFT_1232 [Chiua virens]